MGEENFHLDVLKLDAHSPQQMFLIKYCRVGGEEGKELNFPLSVKFRFKLSNVHIP